MNTLVIGIIVVGVIIGIIVFMQRTPTTKCPRTFNRADSPVCPAGFSIQSNCTCSPCDEKSTT